ncbi:MAG: hypothetical protein LUP99_03980 [Methanomicrobiales archaeon]|nr:hypothetical protein [Methanomicrobiales archaeon]
MSEKAIKKQVRQKGLVECRPGEVITLDYCRFCVHSKAFIIHGKEVPSPARIYCLSHRQSKEEIDFGSVEEVLCEDKKSEGYRSMMNIIG